MSLLMTNNVYLVGELVEIKQFNQGVYGEDKKYVSAVVVIKSIIDDQEILTEAHTFVNELKKDGNVNRNYQTICNIDSMLGKRVVISGASLKGERFWSTRTNQLSNSVKINFNLIRLASNNDKEDKATFEFGGFVTRPLTEVVDQENNIKYYQITLGQANYSENNMFECTFTVMPDNVAAARIIEERYETGSTVQINGVCRTIVTVVEKNADVEVAFGYSTPKKFTNVDKKFVIVGGTDVITGEGEYKEEDIRRLVAAYSEEGKAIQNKAVKNDSSERSQPASKPRSKSSSLAGLI